MSRRGRSPEVSKQEAERARERILKRKLAAGGQTDSSAASAFSSSSSSSSVHVSKWDQAPSGFEGMSVGEVAAHAPRLLHMPIGSAVVNPNQLRQARRLYVGNIPPKALSEEAVTKFFNTAMLSAGKTGLGSRPPIVGAQINFEKGYAFLEFDHSKIATECMMFDGIILEGNTLKLRRPKDYVALPEAYKEDGDLSTRPKVKGTANIADLVPAGLCSTTVPDSPNKLFCGAIPNHLSEEQVKELFCSFGALKGFNMVRDKAKGCYAFFEYVDPSVTDQAVNGLHGMKIGEKTLIVQRSSTGGPQHQQQQFMLGDPSAIASNPAAAACLTLGVPLVNILSSLNVDRDSEPSSTLILVNLFRPKDLMSEDDYEDALADIRQEMELYGRINNLTIVRPAVEEETLQLEGRRYDWAPNNSGFVYCTFSTLAEAQAAQKALQGRRFNGRFVITLLAPRTN